jgi:hypothetical protein
MHRFLVGSTAARRLLKRLLMQLRRSEWVAAVVLATSTVAHADAKLDLLAFSSSVTEATKDGKFGNNHFFKPPGDCDKVVAAGNAEGLKATDTFTDGDGNTVLWKRAADVCKQYAKLHAVGKTWEAVESMVKVIPTYKSMSGTDGKPDPSMRGDAFREQVKRARECVKTIDDSIGKGTATDVTIAYGDNVGTMHRETLVEIKQICVDYITWSGDAAVADDKRIATELAALKAKYTKLGITGDRLDYLVKWGHLTVFGKGCSELKGKALKSAPAFYSLGQDDLAWIVYKTGFKGDKQVSYTSARYRKDGSWRCK